MVLERRREDLVCGIAPCMHVVASAAMAALKVGSARGWACAASWCVQRGQSRVSHASGGRRVEAAHATHQPLRECGTDNTLMVYVCTWAE